MASRRGPQPASLGLALAAASTIPFKLGLGAVVAALSGYGSGAPSEYASVALGLALLVLAAVVATQPRVPGALLAVIAVIGPAVILGLALLGAFPLDPYFAVILSLMFVGPTVMVAFALGEDQPPELHGIDGSGFVGAFAANAIVTGALLAIPTIHVGPLGLGAYELGRIIGSVFLALLAFAVGRTGLRTAWALQREEPDSRDRLRQVLVVAFVILGLLALVALPQHALHSIVILAIPVVAVLLFRRRARFEPTGDPTRAATALVYLLASTAPFLVLLALTNVFRDGFTLRYAPLVPLQWILRVLAPIAAVLAIATLVLARRRSPHVARAALASAVACAILLVASVIEHFQTGESRAMSSEMYAMHATAFAVLARVVSTRRWPRGT